MRKVSTGNLPLYIPTITALVVSRRTNTGTTKYLDIGLKVGFLRTFIIHSIRAVIQNTIRRAI